MTRENLPEGIAPNWRERLEAGALRLPVHERTALIERLVVSHERYDEIAALWRAEAERRMAEIRAGRMEWIPAEVVLAEREELVEDGPECLEPAIPESVDEIEREALYLPNDDFYLLLVNLEAALPEEVDLVWRADIQRRIATIPGEFERRYRECNGGLGS